MEFNIVDLTTENQTRRIRKTAPNHKIKWAELADYEAGTKVSNLWKFLEGIMKKFNGNQCSQ